MNRWDDAFTKASASQDVDFAYYSSPPNMEVSGNELCHYAGFILMGLCLESLGMP